MTTPPQPPPEEGPPGPGQYPYWTPPKSNGGAVLGIGLGGGLGMTIWGRDAIRGLGIGLMIGWATAAIMTGFVVGCMSMLDGLE